MRTRMTLKKTVCKPHNKREILRSQTQSLGQLAASINKLVDINAKRLNVEKDDSLALLKFRKEEAKANQKLEKEVVESVVHGT